MFFQDLFEFVIHCNKLKDIFFSVCLFIFLTIDVTGRNEAIIVELKELRWWRVFSRRGYFRAPRLFFAQVHNFYLVLIFGR